MKESITILVAAKSFLHSQVRIMVGTLVNVGEGKIQPADIKKIIASGVKKFKKEVKSNKYPTKKYSY